MTLAPGTRLGLYEIVAPLGAGGMGEVYRARDTRLGRDVALKTLPAQLASDPASLHRFEREAKTVAGLNHPNIVVLHSIEEADGVRFLTMELVEGQRLAQILAPGGLPLSEVLDLALPLTDALIAAHEKGIVHRDLKPSNVMVTKDGRLKVLDFGLAKLVAAVEMPDLRAPQRVTVTSPLTGTGQTVGTVPYMAPEQLRAEAVDARTDLFALGVILYELLTGRRPFTGNSLIEVGFSIIRDVPTPVTAVCPELPRDMARIVGRCLEKDPRDRFQTARDVYNELRLVRRALEGTASALAGSSAPFPIPIPDDRSSIAVLPFVNMSKDEENEYFADGLSEELLNLLAKIRGLRVASRTSAFYFKGKDVDLATVARKLNVVTILDGSVRKSGNRVRITAQLIDVCKDSHLWSETYDRELEDIFAVQDEIARSVVTELRVALLGEVPDALVSAAVQADVAVAAKGRGENAEAYRLYLEGQFFARQYTQASLAKGIECYRRALEADPAYALAWAGLSLAYAIQGTNTWAPQVESCTRAREAAERALQLEPDLPEGHVALGRVRKIYEWDWRGAATSFRRALELAPKNESVVSEAAALARTLGQLEEAVALNRCGVTLDPLNASTHYWLGRNCLSAGLLDEAEAELRKALELSPQAAVVSFDLGCVHMAQGRMEEALEAMEREPTEAWRLLGHALAHHAMGRTGESDAAMRVLIEKYAGTDAFQIAEGYAYLGEVDRAFEWLERAYAQRDTGLGSIKVDYLLRDLHGDPRWRPFLEKIGLAD